MKIQGHLKYKIPCVLQASLVIFHKVAVHRVADIQSLLVYSFIMCNDNHISPFCMFPIISNLPFFYGQPPPLLPALLSFQATLLSCHGLSKKSGLPAPSQF